nr:putative ribonuclease H-like domain-containing protein [Tanacetum cinerariifolium]
MFDCDKMFNSESDVSMPASPIYDRYQSGEGYHVVLPPYTGTFMPPKPDLVFHDAPNVNETVHTAFNIELSPTKPDIYLSHTHRPSAPIIEDWVSDLEDDSAAELPQNASSFVQPTEQVKTLRPFVKPVEHSILAANHKTVIPKPKSLGNSMTRKACFVCKSLTHMIKDRDYYETKMAQTPIRNHAQRGNYQHYARMTLSNPQRHVVPTAVLTKSKLVPLTAARLVTTAVPQPHVTRPRLAKTVVTKPFSPPKRNINRRPSPKPSTFPPKVTTVKAPMVTAVKGGNPQHDLKDKGVIDSGCLRHMIGNMSYLSNFEEINGRYVAFGGNPKGGKISGKGKIRTGKLDFDDVYFIKELKFNIFSISQVCDKKNKVLFTDTECVVLSLEFKLPDENQVLLRVPRENNMYNVNLKNIFPSGDLTCLFAKATLNESNLWHRRLGHINFKTMNKLVKGNLVRGLPSKFFENNHTCVACKKGKQHRASCKTKPVSSISQPLQRLHMDLFGPTFIKSLNKKVYFLAITYDYSRFTWVFFLATKNETSPILKTFITSIENQLSLKVKIIRSDNGTEFKNQDLNQFCRMKGIKREFNVPRTPQQNRITKRKNKTLIEAVTTMLANSLLPIPFWVNAVNTACYVQNRNTNGDATFEVKEPEFEVEKPESEVHVSPSSSAQIKKHDDKTKREAKRKSHVELSTGYRNLSAEFKDFSDNSINEVNVIALEDITYSDDEEDVGAEADFTNLETFITEEGIDYEEVFAPVARIEATRLFLAYASFMVFMVYQMDVKSAFLYETIKEEVYVCQPPGFEDPDYPDKIYKVVTTLYGLHQAPRACQDKYVAEILRKFGLTDEKSASTPIDTEKPLLNDPDSEDMDVHTYRSMIGSLMYLTSSRPDIIYLKGKPHLGLWYPKDSPFNLVAYSNSDYVGASLDKKSTTGGYQFLRCRLISWQCKKQTIVATSSTKAEYVAVASCCAQVP